MGRKSRAKALQRQQASAGAEMSSIPAGKRWRRDACLLLSALIVGASVTFVATVLCGRSGSAAPIAKGHAVSFGDLLTMSPEQLAGMDVALMNLLCAQGLPGAEKLDVPACLATLDKWATHVKQETDRNLFRLRNPADAAHYGNSEAKYRAEMLVQVLQEDFGVRYHDGFDPEPTTPPVFKTSKDCFLHGLVNDPNGGNCVSMPVAYIAVARRLGYPVKFVTSREHTFCRWEGMDHPNPAWRERFNFDAPGKGFSIDPDDFYMMWPKVSTPEQVQAHQWLKSLTPTEELSLFLVMRGHVLKDNRRLQDAQVAYAVANQLWPASRKTAYWLARIVDMQFHLTETVASRMADDPAIDEWQSPAGMEAHRQQVERINAENRLLREQQRRRLTRMQQGSMTPVPGDPAWQNR